MTESSFDSLNNRDLNKEVGESNGTPLQYSCLENPMDGGAWWAAVRGVTRSRTRLKQLSSSSSSKQGSTCLCSMAFQRLTESEAMESVFFVHMAHTCWEQSCPLSLSVLVQQETEINIWQQEDMAAIAPSLCLLLAEVDVHQ